MTEPSTLPPYTLDVLPEHTTMITDIHGATTSTLTAPPPVQVPASARATTSTNTPTYLNDETRHSSVQVVQYNFKDRFIAAINLAGQIDALQSRCMNKSELRMKHVGEYMAGLRELIQNSKDLDAITQREGEEMMKYVLGRAETVITANTQDKSEQLRQFWSGLVVRGYIGKLTWKLVEAHMMAEVVNYRSTLAYWRDTRERQNVTQ